MYTQISVGEAIEGNSRRRTTKKETFAFRLKGEQQKKIKGKFLCFVFPFFLYVFYYSQFAKKIIPREMRKKDTRMLYKLVNIL